MKKILLSILCLTVATWGVSVHAGTEADLLQKHVDTMQLADDAKSASELVAAIIQSTTRSSTCKNTPDRRQLDLITLKLQDRISKMNSPEAQKNFANQLPRLDVETQVALLFGLKLAEANPDVDAAALKLLEPRADNRVKVALLELLTQHRVFSAVEKIHPLLTPEAFFSVQISACRALALLPDKRSIPVLLKFMESFKNKGNGRLMYEAVAALRSMTGEKTGVDFPAWSKWWVANEKKLVIDANKPAAPIFNFEQGAEAVDVTYYGIPVVENRIAFVLDISGSMAYGGKPNRMEQAVTELKKIIGKLNERQQFNVIAFSGTTNRWQRKECLVAANESNRKDAIRFLEQLKPGGGTNTASVIEECIRDIAIVAGCEAIYLATDGAPNPWAKGITTPIQESYLTFHNQPWKVRINTIGIYTTTAREKIAIARDEDNEGMKEFLYNLATNNDGVYREIGKN